MGMLALFGGALLVMSFIIVRYLARIFELMKHIHDVSSFDTGEADKASGKYYLISVLVGLGFLLVYLFASGNI